MNCKKYIFMFLICTIFIYFGVEKVYAYAKVETGTLGDSGTCFYKDAKAALWIKFTYAHENQDWDSFSGAITQTIHDAEVVIQEYNGEYVGLKHGKIENLYSITEPWQFDTDLINVKKIKTNYPEGCPPSINVKKNFIGQYEIYLSDTNSGIKTVSPSDFFDNLPCENGKCEFGKDIDLVCTWSANRQNNSLFGDPNHAGSGLFGDNEVDGEYDPPSIAYLINKILEIARIIVIAIVITLGIIDIAKAVLASKEDEMKKAQSTFVKRIIACVVVFLVPTLVNIIMNLSHDLWESSGYETCTLEQINGNGYSGRNGKF